MLCPEDCNVARLKFIGPALTHMHNALATFEVRWFIRHSWLVEFDALFDQRKIPKITLEEIITSLSVRVYVPIKVYLFKSRKEKKRFEWIR